MATVVEGPFGPQQGENVVEPKANGRRDPRAKLWSDARYGGQWESDEDVAPAHGWLVKHVLPGRGVGVLAGQSAVGKTYIALDLTQCVILGNEFAGHMVERQGGVLLFAAEAPMQVKPRWEGLRKAKIAPWFEQRGEAMPRLPFKWITNVPRITADNAYGELSLFCGRMREELQTRYECELVLVIIDTMSAAGDFRDPNDVPENQRVMNTLARLASEYECAVLVVDHFGKDADRGVRGSSAKEASADFVLGVYGKKDTETGVASDLKLTVRKMRGGSAGVEVPFGLKKIIMGQDDDGDEVSEMVVQWQEGATPKRRAWNNKRFSTLRSALDEALIGGRLVRPAEDYPMVLAVTDAVLRAKFAVHYPPTGEGVQAQEQSIKKAYRRAMADAKGQQLIGTYRAHNGEVLVWKVERDSNGQPVDSSGFVRAV